MDLVCHIATGTLQSGVGSVQAMGFGFGNKGGGLRCALAMAEARRSPVLLHRSDAPFHNPRDCGCRPQPSELQRDRGCSKQLP